MIDDATTDQDLRVPPSNQWRLVFLWDAMNTPRQRERIERTKPLSAAA
jgi:plasmid maintenance system killer protein